MPVVAPSLPLSGPEWLELRESRAMTRRELALRTGLSPTTLRALEAGEHTTLSTRLLVAAALGIDVFGHRSES